MDMEQLSFSEPNVVSRTLAILLGDDYRQPFLGQILGLIEVPGAAEISMAGQPTFFTRPLLVRIPEDLLSLHERVAQACEVLHRLSDLQAQRGRDDPAGGR